MTIAEMLESERNNTQTMMLHREGMFLKAYERSAFLAYNYIHPFKLTLKYVKNVGCNVISLGFPYKTLPKWLHGYKYETSNDGMHIYCLMKHGVMPDEFENWKSTVDVNKSEHFTPHTLTIEKTPLYKKCYDLLIEVCCFSKNISKQSYNPFGVELKHDVYKLCYNIRMYYDIADKERCVAECRELSNRITFLLQILKDLREISLNHFSLSCELIVSVGKQLEMLHRKVMANVNVV